MPNIHHRLRIAAAVSVLPLAACTNGAAGSLAGGGAGAGITTIDVSLTAFGATTIAAGRAAGYSPAQVDVPVGTQIRFVNADSFTHTASAVSGLTFPAGSPLTAAALTPSAGITPLSSGWSSGNLAAGASSPVFVADTPGTYLFGCFYHYGAPMRGAIVVR